MSHLCQKKFNGISDNLQYYNDGREMGQGSSYGSLESGIFRRQKGELRKAPMHEVFEETRNFEL